VWEIPVCYKRERGGTVQPAACALLSAQTQTVKLDGCSSWIFANVDSRGYYRTSYGADELRTLGEAAINDKLNTLEQTTLLEDLWALVRLDDQNIADYLSLSSQLMKSRLSPALSTALYRVNYIAEWLVDEPLRPAFRRWVRESVRPLVNRLGWTPKPNESEEIQSLRSTALFTLGSAGGDADALREARRLADLHLTGAARLHPSITDTVLRLAAIEGDAALYEKYLSQLKDSTSSSDQLQFLSALSFFADPALRTRTLAYATSQDIRSQDAPMLIRQLMQRPEAGGATWEHVKSNWNGIVRTFGIFQGIPDVVGSLQHFCDANARRDVDRFFSEHPVAGAERTIERSLEQIERCAATKSEQADNLAAFLTR